MGGIFGYFRRSSNKLGGSQNKLDKENVIELKKDYGMAPSQNIDEESSDQDDEACDFHLSLAGSKLNKEYII